MNPLLQRLQPYPFERLRQLFAGVSPHPGYPPISLGIGEPRHPAPQFLKDRLSAAIQAPAGGLSQYPATAGTIELRQACAAWLKRRYGLAVDADQQILPVNGSREALFSLAQTVVNPRAFVSGQEPIVVCPNPFYQIYEGAAYLAGAQPYFVPSNPEKNFATAWSSVPAAVWEQTQLLYTCSPGNPTGAVMPLEEWAMLFELSDRYGFVIACDECYSEIYFQEEAPLGGLEAASKLGRTDFRRLISLTSLSKRSNVPGLRSGFVAGHAELIRDFLLYRTYHGSAMSTTVQSASAAAWLDEPHVQANREQYRAKFTAITPLLAEVMQVRLPDAGFYLWAEVPTVFGGRNYPDHPQRDVIFARELFAQYNVTVLPGSYLARESGGTNPGRHRIRMALVAETTECMEAAQRIVRFIQSSISSPA